MKRPELAKALLYGPLSPVQFRMDGHGRLPDADQDFARESARFGCVASPKLTTAELQGLEMLAANLSTEQWLTALLDKVR